MEAPAYNLAMLEVVPEAVRYDIDVLNEVRSMPDYRGNYRIIQ